MKIINSSICYHIKKGLTLTYAMTFSTVIIAAAPVENIKTNSNKNNHIISKSMPQSLNVDAIIRHNYSNKKLDRLEV